jgi:hypothetical protein
MDISLYPIYSFTDLFKFDMGNFYQKLLGNSNFQVLIHNKP